ncbi:MAG TPA: phosphate ABC transporter substrate-binding/OmpA family protein [Polyangiaceae bacterium]|nr:phosphate ABC transporter substrate-binding/OmpA family protein [Polyangiaceae bacterium]
MQKLTALSKLLIAGILIGSGVTAYRTYGGMLHATAEPPRAEAARVAPAPSGVVAAVASAAARPGAANRPLKVALSQWPGHMALVVGAGGLKTQPGSIAAREGLDLEIVFIEDAPSKNKALQSGEVDFVWQTVDELPISLASYRAQNIDAKAFLQIDWSRGGDACVASKEVQKVEDIWGRKSAVLMFSPDHTVFEFMINNSRLTREQVSDVRKATKFSPDDFTYARVLFEKKEVDVACLWEPDVTLALASRPGAHRLFSTADATELVADVLFTKKDFLDRHADLAQKLARTWFAAVTHAERDRPAAAKLISTVASRFRDELGYEKTLAALGWAKWTNLSDNVKLFGLDGGPPAFDRVYNQADGIWINYPEAEIKDRFAPVVLRDDRVVKAIWESEGKPVAKVEEPFVQEEARTGAAIFTKPVSIQFPSGSSELSAESIAAINQQVLPQLLIAAGMYARIEGNTDSIGEFAANQVLSEKRAGAIVSYLVSRGIPPERLVARGNGPAVPVATNKTPEGRAQNRRTDVLFIRRRATP